MSQLTDADLLEFQAMHRVEVTPEFEGPWDAKVYGESDKPEAIYVSTLSRRILFMRPVVGGGGTPREALTNAAVAYGVAASAGEPISRDTP